MKYEWSFPDKVKGLALGQWETHAKIVGGTELGLWVSQRRLKGLEFREQVMNSACWAY